jgi:hypothetical protein
MIVPERPEKGTGTGCRRIEIVMAKTAGALLSIAT